MFSRLDLRFGYRPRGVSGRWEVYVEGLNVLKHTNAWFMDADLVDRGAACAAVAGKTRRGTSARRDVRPALSISLTQSLDPRAPPV